LLMRKGNDIISMFILLLVQAYLSFTGFTNPIKYLLHRNNRLRIPRQFYYWRSYVLVFQNRLFINLRIVKETSTTFLPSSHPLLFLLLQTILLLF
jgi:hypothetical protein